MTEPQCPICHRIIDSEEKKLADGKVYHQRCWRKIPLASQLFLEENAKLKVALETETQKREALTIEVNDLSQQRGMLRHTLNDLIAEVFVWAEENTTELHLVDPEERTRLYEALNRASIIAQHAYDNALTYTVFVNAGYVVAGSE